MICLCMGILNASRRVVSQGISTFDLSVSKYMLTSRQINSRESKVSRVQPPERSWSWGLYTGRPKSLKAYHWETFVLFKIGERSQHGVVRGRMSSNSGSEPLL